MSNLGMEYNQSLPIMMKMFKEIVCIDVDIPVACFPISLTS